jgi:hypothetical protein
MVQKTHLQMITENKLYNPAAQSKQWLMDHFVVRTKVFEKLFKDIRTSKMKYPEQHYLIQGQRGMGKTTLLLRLKYEIDNTPELNTWLVPVFFNEESYDLRSLSNLWEKLLKYLDELWQTGGTNYEKTNAFVGQQDYEKKCFDLLLELLKKERKKLVIFFDNFGQLFLDNLKEKDQHRLREILMGCAEIRIIGASAIVLKDLHDYSKPFFEFFKIINLEGLDKNETFQLIKALQEKSGTPMDVEKNKAKIETLAILSGGVIRTIMLIYEAILADEDGSALHDLETILDRITPLYKHRIEDLPAQQRHIVDVIAKNWDAISAKEIAANIREDGQQLPSKIISAQLQQLEKNNVIEKKQTTTKNHLYQLKERFFNIWYLMRLGDNYDRCRVKWLTRFLEILYEDEKGLKQFINEHIKHLKSGNYHAGSAILITEALSNSEKLDVSNLELLIKETSAILSNDQKKLLPTIDSRKIKSGIKFITERKYQDAIRLFTSVKSKNSHQNLLLVSAYIQAKQFSDAKQIIDSVVPESNEDIILLGLSYYFLKNYQKCINLLDTYTGHNQATKFQFIAKSQNAIENYEAAIEAYKKAIEHKNLKAYLPLVSLLFRKKQWLEIENYSKEGISLGISDLKKHLIEACIYSQVDSKVKQAKKMIDLELKTDPGNPNFNYLKGIYEYFNGTNLKNSLKYFELAHRNFSKLKSTSVEYQFNLHMLLHILIDITKDKYTAEKILENVYDKKHGIPLYQSLLSVWNSKYSEGIKLLEDWLYTTGFDIVEVESEIIKNTLLILLARKQYYSVYELFENEKNNLKEIFKPIYYTLMHYLKDEYPNELVKMGDELKQPVEDILKRVEQMAIDYK